MKINSKFIASSFLTLAMIVSSAAPVYAVAPEVVDYVALGDSCAAGVRAVLDAPDYLYREVLPGWENKSKYGYTDLIAQWLKDEGVLGKFDESLSVSGNTAAALAEATSPDTAKPVTLKRLSEGELFTITVGANDALDDLYLYFDEVASGIEEPSIPGILTALGECQATFDDAAATSLYLNYVTILTNILNANPQAQIYVMGYYNPLPLLAVLPAPYAMYSTDITPFVNLLNWVIEAAVNTVNTSTGLNSINFIDTIDDINNASVDGILDTIYGPLPIYSINDPMYAYGVPFAMHAPYLYADFVSYTMADIHLTEAGYAKVAGEFIEEIGTDFGLPY